MTARVAFPVADEGVERAEPIEPWDAVMGAGAEPVLVAPGTGGVQLFQPLDKDETRTAMATTAGFQGGVANADEVRTDAPAVPSWGSLIISRKPAGLPALRSAASSSLGAPLARANS